MKKTILTLASVGLAAVALAVTSYPVSGHVSSDTAGSVAMLIKYVGTATPSATTDVAVAAGGDMTFRVAGVASTTVNSALVCGGTAGTLDLSTPAVVTLYSRKDCHLCDGARADLEALQGDVPHKLVVMDVDGDPRLQKEFGLEIPVVVAGPFRLKAPFTRQDLKVMLAAAQDRERHIDLVERSPRLAEVRDGAVWSRSDSFNLWISRHYMLIFNLTVFAYLVLAFLAPTLMQVGAPRAAKLLYKAYGLVCHQLAYRSFFLFGEQLYYPREAAGLTGVMTFSEATGLEESNAAGAIFAARNFVGNEQMGCKKAFLQNPEKYLRPSG